MTFSRPPGLLGFTYDKDTIFNYRDTGKLLCLRLDLTYDCNLNCKYCYTRHLRKNATESSFEELINTVEQGISLGIQSIIMLGGEPLYSPHIYDLLEFLNEKNIIPVIFTNGTLVTKEVASKLFKLNVSIVTKFDGFKETQDFLSGSGSFEKIQGGLKNLISAGFNYRPGEMLRLASECVMTTLNYKEVPDIWRYLRRNNIFPSFERMTLTETENTYLALTNHQVKEITETLRRIDEDEFGIRWGIPNLPFPGFACSIFWTGCHVNPYREISACPELPPVDSLRKKPLHEIIQEQNFIKTRYIEKSIDQKCADCEYLLQVPCHGCRSKAFYRTGSLFAADIECPITIKKEI